MVVGLIQGVTELFPVSSLGHNVLIPALIGGSWAQDLSVSAPESPYLAFIVGLHVATAAALILYFWRDWVRLVGGFVSSLRERRIATADQRLAWMIILATIPVGIAGLAARARLPRVLQQADTDRDVPRAQRGDPARRRAGSATARAVAPRADRRARQPCPPEPGWPAGGTGGRPDGRAGRAGGRSQPGRASRRARREARPGDRGRPAAFRHGLRPGPADRRPRRSPRCCPASAGTGWSR